MLEKIGNILFTIISIPINILKLAALFCYYVSITVLLLSILVFIVVFLLLVILPLSIIALPFKLAKNHIGCKDYFGDYAFRSIKKQSSGLFSNEV